MGGVLATIPVILLVSEVFTLTPSTERLVLPPLLLSGVVGGILAGVRIGRRAKRADLPHLEVFDDRVVVPARGPLGLAIRVVIPFSELSSVSAVKNDALIITGRRSSVVLSWDDIASVASMPGIQAEIEAAVRESGDGDAVARRLAEEAAATEGLAERPIPVTNGLVLILMAAYVLQWFVTSPTEWNETLLRLGANFRGSWNQGHAYRLVTANYLHANLIHLLSNIGALASFGLLVEKLLGPTRMIAIYGVSTLAGAFASSFTDSLAVGASTGVFGLMAATLFVQTRHGNRLPNTVRIDRNSWIVLVAVNGALPLVIPNISWAGHAGGALAGLLVSGLVAAAPTSIDGRPAGRGLHVVAAMAIAIHIVGVMVGAWYFLRPMNFPEISIRIPR